MIHTLDLHHLGVPEAIAAHLLELGDDHFALIDPGPESTLATLLNALSDAGFTPAGLRAVLVTHVHLDHAGAAGALATRYGARVYAHPRAAPHLLNPSRLLASATRIYGAQLRTLWGTMTPVPAAQLVVLEAEERLTLGREQLRALPAPGHANHQYAYLTHDGALFPGDAAAIRLPGQQTLMPATAPPEIDLAAWQATLTRFTTSTPSAMYLPHFGPVTEVAEHLARLRDALPKWAELIRAGLTAHEDNHALAARLETQLRADLHAEGVPAPGIERAIRAAGPLMCALGLRRALSNEASPPR